MQRRNFWDVSILSLLSLWGVGTLLTSCTADDEYNPIHLGIYINNATHQDATLASAMNPASPGVFCLIKYDASKKAFAFSSNQGLSSESAMTAIEQQQGFASRMGMNNTGIIVGYGNLSTNSSGGYIFYAYDRECPNCFDYNAIPMKSYPLTMNSAGVATCANCKRQYKMNTGGNCINSTSKKDKKMTHYRCSTTGALGYLVVN